MRSGWYLRACPRPALWANTEWNDARHDLAVLLWRTGAFLGTLVYCGLGVLLHSVRLCRHVWGPTPCRSGQAAPKRALRHFSQMFSRSCCAQNTGRRHQCSPVARCRAAKHVNQGYLLDIANCCPAQSFPETRLRRNPSFFSSKKL